MKIKYVSSASDLFVAPSISFVTEFDRVNLTIIKVTPFDHDLAERKPGSLVKEWHIHCMAFYVLMTVGNVIFSLILGVGTTFRPSQDL